MLQAMQSRPFLPWKLTRHLLVLWMAPCRDLATSRAHPRGRARLETGPRGPREAGGAQIVHSAGSSETAPGTCRPKGRATDRAMGLSCLMVCANPAAVQAVIA